MIYLFYFALFNYIALATLTLILSQVYLCLKPAIILNLLGAKQEGRKQQPKTKRKLSSLPINAT